jgi:hypothetical protein
MCARFSVSSNPVGTKAGYIPALIWDATPGEYTPTAAHLPGFAFASLTMVTHFSLTLCCLLGGGASRNLVLAAVVSDGCHEFTDAVPAVSSLLVVVLCSALFTGSPFHSMPRSRTGPML